jgi:hypothetical protein
LTIPHNTTEYPLIEKNKILLLFRRAYLKPVFQLLRGIVSLPVSLVFSGLLLVKGKGWVKMQFPKKSDIILNAFPRYNLIKLTKVVKMFLFL